MSTYMQQLGTILGQHIAQLNAGKASVEQLTNSVAQILGTASSDYDTLGKLEAKIGEVHNLAVGASRQVTVADIAARDALVVEANTAIVAFVLDDGDAKWAMYRIAADADGVKTYAKLSDPDLLNLPQTAAQVKAAYEANPDTNAFTDAEKDKLAALPTNAALDSRLGDIESDIGDTSALTTTAKNLAGAINEVKAAATSGTTDAVTALKGDVTTAGDTLGKLEDRVESLETQAAAVAGEIADAVAGEATARDTAIATAVTALKGGVTADYDTLKKLQDKILSVHDIAVTAAQQISVADIAGRDAVAIAPETSVLIFVTDDGDSRWALYRGMADDQGVKSYVKLSDPDLLNAAMSASAIKTAYESNADTNAFTDADLAKLTALPTAAEYQADIDGLDADLSGLSGEIGSLASLTTTEKGTVVGAINEVKAAVATEASDRAGAITAAVAALKGDADASNDTLGKLADRIDSVSADLSNLSQDKIVSGDMAVTVSDGGFGGNSVTFTNGETKLFSVDGEGNAQLAGSLNLGDGLIVLDPTGTLYSAVNANIGGTLYAGNSEHVLSDSGNASFGSGILKVVAADGTLLYNNVEVAKTTDVAALKTELLGGVPEAGNTLNKLYNLAVAAVDKIAVADIAARDALVLAPNTSKVVHVADDGDGKWAVYWAFADAEGDLSFEKISDPDQLNAVMSDAAIKAALLNNADTNVLTDAEYAQVGRIGDLTTLTTTAKGDLVSAINEVDAHADAVDAKVGDVATLTTTEKSTVVGAVNEVKAAVDSVGTYAEFLAAFNAELA